MKTKNTIEVYWAPATFIPEEESWSLLYQEPKPILSNLITNSVPKALMPTCPAVKETFKNVFSLDSSIDDYHTLDPKMLSEAAHRKIENETISGTGGKVPLFKPRATSIDGYINVSYGLRWLFFASEPTTMRLTAPYYPAYSPTDSALFSAGEFDIGRWYRQTNLDWHLPVQSTSFEVKAGSPLAFIEFKTDKKIIFKRYKLTKTLMNLAFEISNSSNTMGKHKSLLERYRQAHSAKIPAMVMSEIQQNLIDELCN